VFTQYHQADCDWRRQEQTNRAPKQRPEQRGDDNGTGESPVC
jgi:hypothetical protein